MRPWEETKAGSLTRTVNNEAVSTPTLNGADESLSVAKRVHMRMRAVPRILPSRLEKSRVLRLRGDDARAEELASAVRVGRRASAHALPEPKDEPRFSGPDAAVGARPVIQVGECAQQLIALEPVGTSRRSFLRVRLVPMTDVARNE